MKRIIYFFTVILLGSVSVNATTTSTNSVNSFNTYANGYGNSFIFVENGIEF